MGNTVNMLKLAIAGFIQRDPSVFVRGVLPNTFDLLLQACNNARLYAERRIDFELSKVDVDIAGVDLLNGQTLNNAVLHGTTTPVRIKKIITPFLPLAQTAASGQPISYPVDLMARKTWDERVKRRFEAARPTDTQDFAFITDAPFAVVQSGNVIYVTPPDVSALTSPFTIYANVVQWMAPYVDTLDGNMDPIPNQQNDFLLDNCFDWMMFYGISQLNFYLKEDERVQLSDKMLVDTFDSMVKWNNELIESSVDDTNLD